MKFTRQIPLLLVLFFIPYLQASVNPKLKIDFKQNTNIIFQKNENFLNNKSRTNSSADFELHCTPNVKIPSCRTQNQVDSLFEIWLSGASISGGCKSFLTVGSATSPDHCGGITTAHFTAYSECDSTLSCDATFEVESASPLTLACPEFVVESSCQSQNTIELKFNNWIQSAIISGGCSNPKYFNFQYTHLPSHCGDSVLTTINTLDQCYTVLSCTSTFVVTAADSAILTCPTNQIVDTGHSQTEIDSLFFIWKNSATYSGACNLELSISMGEAPKSIGGATIVSYQLLSDCSDTLRCNSKFKVVSILPVTLFCPENAIEASCQTQSAIDLKFAAWKKQASFTGGCDAILTSDNFTAPNSCGGSISLTFTVNSDCEELLSCTSSFTIQSAPPSSLNCPVNVVEDFNQTQQTIDEKFSTWKTTAQFTGGCNGILSSSNGIAPSSTGGTTNVKFTLNNDCDNEKSCTARFSVRSANNFSLKCPGILIERSCQSQDTIDEKFESWISTATFMGGCNAVISNNRTKNPSACGDTTVITFTVLSDCDSSITCIDTFIVEETLPVVLNCPNSVTELACQTQSTIDAKYNAWIQSVSVTGGCNNFVIVHGGLPPNACGGIASIIFEDTSSCQALISCTSTFNVTNAPNIALTCPAFVTESACQTQAAIDAKFAAWKNTVSFIGGCNGVLSNSGNTSPNACGGVENVTFSVTSDCQTPVTCVATFKVTNAPTIALTCPTFVIENACQTQAAIDAKFAAWKNT
ncbi:MAG: hypothetical protein ABI851_14170, partial [Saprospiraceae bacterium]